MALIISIFEYSPNENKANPIAEYSTLYPETNSASASGKSNGCLLVSAKADVKNNKNNGKKRNNKPNIFLRINNFLQIKRSST